jgi:hypothetical protein
MRVEKQTSLRLRKEVRVLLCACNREREVIKDDDLRFVTTASDKFRIQAERL